MLPANHKPENIRQPKQVYAALLLCGLLVCWLCTGLVAIVLTIYSFRDVVSLQNIVYHDREFNQFAIPISRDRFYLLRGFYLAFFGMVTLLLTGIFLKSGKARKQFLILKEELFAALQALFCLPQLLSLPEKRVALLLLLVLMVVRTFLVYTFPDYVDEITSYHYFVSKSSLSVTSFYPMPNNHILSNLICRLLYYFTSYFSMVMRLPTFLFSFAGTVVLYLMALRYSNFVVATIGVSLFCFTELGLFYSIAGRGYYIFFYAAGLLFFLTYSLLTTNNLLKIKWAVWVVASVAGFYTMPPFLYPFSAACLISLVYFLGSKNRAGLTCLLIAGFIVAVSCLLLYLPVISVSGLKALTGNSYVIPLRFNEFWADFGAFAYNIERKINGLNVVGIIILLLSLTLFFAFSRKNILPKNVTRLGYLAIGFGALPYLILLFQQVYPPVRVLYYKSVFMHLVFGIVVFGLVRSKFENQRYRALVVLLICLLSAAPQTLKFIIRTLAYVEYEKGLQRKYATLMEKKPRYVLLNDDFHEIYFTHYAKLQNHQVIFHSNRQNITYDAVLMDTTDAGPRWP